MTLFKKFWETRIKKNCAWYAIPLSTIFTWRYTHLRGIPFAGIAAVKLYFVFLATTYVALMIVFFVLFALGINKTQQ